MYTDLCIPTLSIESLDVYHVPHSINPNKSKGFHNLPKRLLKNCAQSLATFQTSLQLYPSPVVPNLFYISYPFVKQDYQIYSQYTQWRSFIKNTKLTNCFSLE